jgi:hypothetical protein
MWLAAWLWAQKGVGMGVGWGRTPFSERREGSGVEGHFQNALGSGALGGPSRKERTWRSCAVSLGVWVRGGVGGSEGVCRREGGREEAGELGARGEGRAGLGAPGSELQRQGA